MIFRRNREKWQKSWNVEGFLSFFRFFGRLPPENHHSVVSHGADINAEDIYGNTALIFASRNAVFLDGDNFSETRRKRRTINPRRRTSQGRPMMVEKCIERLKNIKSVESNRQINSCINL